VWWRAQPCSECEGRAGEWDSGCGERREQRERRGTERESGGVCSRCFVRGELRKGELKIHVHHDGANGLGGDESVWLHRVCLLPSSGCLSTLVAHARSRLQIVREKPDGLVVCAPVDLPVRLTYADVARPASKLAVDVQNGRTVSAVHGSLTPAAARDILIMLAVSSAAGGDHSLRPLTALSWSRLVSHRVSHPMYTFGSVRRPSHCAHQVNRDSSQSPTRPSWRKG
jgi:hypothetical protein